VNSSPASSAARGRLREVTGRIGISPDRGTFRLGPLRTHVAAAAYTVSAARARGLPARLLVRIDDTNRAKASPAHVAALLAELTEVGQVPLRALGTGTAPLISWQSSRASRYREAAEALVSRNLAVVLPDRSVAVSLSGDGLAHSPEFTPTAHVTRITRSDGSALWHLASAVDDLDYAVSVCVRGVDKLSAEPVQRALIQGLEAEPPAYYYLPRVLPASGSDLVSDFRTAGFRDATLFSYIASSLLKDDGECRSFAELAARITVRSDLRQHVLLDGDRIAKLERRVSSRLTGAAMYADLEGHCARAGDAPTCAYLSRYPVSSLLERYPRSLHEQHRLAGSLARQTFTAIDLGGIPGHVFDLVRHSAQAPLAFLAAQGTSRTDSHRLLRWILSGLPDGPDVADLWNWHAQIGSLHSQVSAAASAASRIQDAAPEKTVAGPGDMASA
jgi:hypothetical protein